MRTVGLQLHQETVELMGTVFVHPLTSIAERCLSSLFDGFRPEIVEVAGVLCIGFQLLRRESHFHVVLTAFAVDGGLQLAVKESRTLHRTHMNSCTPVFQSYRTFTGGSHHVGSYLIAHLSVLGYAIAIELHLYLGLLARFVEPVGMVGDGHPQIVIAIGIILCGQLAG